MTANAPVKKAAFRQRCLSGVSGWTVRLVAGVEGLVASIWLSSAVRGRLSASGGSIAGQTSGTAPRLPAHNPWRLCIFLLLAGANHVTATARPLPATSEDPRSGKEANNVSPINVVQLGVRIQLGT